MTISLSIGPQNRKSPFFQSTLRDGLTSASIYNHMYFPTSYGDRSAEYDRLLKGVAMWDVSIERQVAFKGRDAVKLARYLTGRNLGDLQIGQGKYIPLCDYRGRLINDPILLQISEDEIWLSIADSDIKLWVSGIADSLEYRVDVFEPDASPLAVQGPLAAPLIADLFGQWVHDLKFFGFEKTKLKGIPVILARSGWSKQGGFEIYLLDNNLGESLWAEVKSAGAKYNIGPGAPNYVERLESGLLSFRTDCDEHSNPFEFGLGRFIDLDQNQEFIGKAALRKIKQTGVKRDFIGLRVDGPMFNSPPEDKSSIYADDNYVGYASAAAYSPRLNSNIAVGVIDTRHAIDGSEVVVDFSDCKREARVTPLPIIR